MKAIKLLISLAIFTVLISCGNSHTNSKSKQIKIAKPKSVNTLKYSVDKKILHSQQSFTEGLLYHDGQLFESTGSPKDISQTVSVYGTVDSLTGEINVYNMLDNKYFGEGICILNNRVFQLTYKSRKGFVYDLSTNKKLDTFKIPTQEGWGLTTDGTNLIMTDGSAYIHFIDPITLKKNGGLKVFNHRGPVDNLNEVEYIDGYIYANVYTGNEIVKIDIETGEVVAKINLNRLKIEEYKINSNVLETNGIAYNPSTKQFYVTGKMWRYIYIISLSD